MKGKCEHDWGKWEIVEHRQWRTENAEGNVLRVFKTIIQKRVCKICNYAEIDNKELAVAVI